MCSQFGVVRVTLTIYTTALYHYDPDSVYRLFHIAFKLPVWYDRDNVIYALLRLLIALKLLHNRQSTKNINSRPIHTTVTRYILFSVRPDCCHRSITWPVSEGSALSMLLLNLSPYGLPLTRLENGANDSWTFCSLTLVSSLIIRPETWTYIYTSSFPAACLRLKKD